MTLPNPAGGALVLSAEWVPDMPKRLTKKEWRQYRAGRDSVIAEAAALIGGGIAMVEL
ncbi:MAG: hypothetical protein KIT07_01470 [Anaerolineales bacterium]|nr:hypothetical protein [Alphaproteobacteria bacterium]MCW5886777.1 hypothetical protein [Anaerolineales bacterium]